MEAKEHFDQIAVEYDKWKEKNWYYYDNLKALYRELIPSNSRVLLSFPMTKGTDGDQLCSLQELSSAHLFH